MFNLKVMGMLFASQVVFLSTVQANNSLNLTGVGDTTLNDQALRLIDPQVLGCQKCTSVAHAGFVVGLLNNLRSQVEGMPGYSDQFSADCSTAFGETISGVNCSFDFTDVNHAAKLGPEQSHTPYSGYTNRNPFNELFSKAFVNWGGKSAYLILTSLHQGVTATTSVPTILVPTTAPTTVPNAITSAPGTVAHTVATVGVKPHSSLVAQDVPALTWELGREGSALMNWNSAAAYCSGKGSGWRLPSIWELSTLHQQKSVLVGFDVDDRWYWSSTLASGDSSIAWFVGFHVSIDYADNQNGQIQFPAAVRCVATSTTTVTTTPAPTVVVTTTPAPTVVVTTAAGATTTTTVAVTGVKPHSRLVAQDVPALTWELGRKGSASMDWSSAVAYCSGKGSGWRLPTVWELYTLYQQKSVLNVDVNDNGHWSSTTDSADYAWSVNFYYYSNAVSEGSVNNRYYVRCVVTP